MAEADSEAMGQPVHLAVVGGGVAGCAAASWASARGVEVTLFNAGLPLGGACIHTGTFPARVLMAAATDHHRANHPRFEGLNTDAGAPNLQQLQNLHRTTGREIQRKYREQLTGRDNVELVEKRAAFGDETTLVAGGNTWEPDGVLLTPGSRSLHPEIEGLEDVSPMSLSDLGELSELPRRVAFAGCNHLALGYGQALARLGSRVVVLTEQTTLFEEPPGDIVVQSYVEMLAGEGVDVALGTQIERVEPAENGGVELWLRSDGDTRQLQSDCLVIADHRKPRVERLDPGRGGVELTDEGYIVIDESLQTTNPRVFAAGDAIGRGGHAYSAAYDAILAAKNAISSSTTAGHTTAVPFAVYTDPQLAGVGWSEPRARESGFLTDVAVCRLENLPAGQALGEHRGFVKLVRDRRSDHLLGARVMAPNAAELIMELALAVRYGLTVTELGSLVHPPISLGEAIGRAARQFAERRAQPVRRQR